jgi:hypothetical protein
MFIEKVIKFGYGDVLVHSNEFLKVLTLTYIEPPKEVGEIIKNDNDYNILDRIQFQFDNDMIILYEDLKHMNPKNTIVKFRDYTFDFTNFNEKSLEVVVRGVKRVINGFTLALAC